MVYINREKFIKKCAKTFGNPSMTLYAINNIANECVADVEEVRHGEWELKSEIRQLLDDVDEDFYVECPICHRIEWIPFMLTEEKMLEYANEHYPYCHCGAKMDGGKKE